MSGKRSGSKTMRSKAMRTKAQGGKKRSRKIGQPPGSLIYVGPKETLKCKITLTDYDKDKFFEKEMERVEDCRIYKDAPSITWINIEGLSKVDSIEKIGTSLGLHPLIMEDIVNTDQRPKFEDYEDYIYIVLTMPGCDETAGKIKTDQFNIILGTNYVVTFEDENFKALDPIRERLRTGKGKLRKMGADYLAYVIIDLIIDNYFTVLENIEDRIDRIEEKLVDETGSEILQDIHWLKRELVMIKKRVWPLRELINALERSESNLLSDPIAPYLRDVYDHVIQIIDTVESYRDIVTGMLETYLSSVSNRMNSVMKILTIIATIFIPLTFIAGIYGMNFKHMPELEWRWGYPAVWAVMILAAGAMVTYFIKKKWL